MLAAALCFLALWAWVGPSPRLDGASVVPVAAGAPRGSWAERPWIRAVACSTGAAAIGWVLFGPGGGLLGLMVGGALAWWLGTLEPTASIEEREAVARDLPIAAELVAACVLVGAPPDRALEVVVDAMDGPLAARLRRVLVKLELGADPVSVWRQLEADPGMATLARVIIRALESGAPLAEGLTRLAADQRRDHRALQQSRARAVGVKSAAPLAACFLPAFMLIGVVPMVVGAFAQLAL